MLTIEADSVSKATITRVAHLVAVLNTDQDTMTAWNVSQQLADVYRQGVDGDHARRTLNAWFQLCANN
jgi:hypothetical protein